MKLFHASWNDSEIVFHEMLWKKNFAVYPSLNFTTILLLICALSRREKPKNYKIVEGENLKTTLCNQLHHFRTIFSNLSNQGVTSHSKIKPEDISDWNLVRTNKKYNTMVAHRCQSKKYIKIKIKKKINK